MTAVSRTRMSADADSVATRPVPVTPTAGSVAAIVTAQALVTPALGRRLRLHKFHLHMDPAAAAGTYNTVTLKLGTTTVFADKFEPGLPYAEAILVVGAVDAALTLTTTTAAAIYYNVRSEEF